MTGAAPSASTTSVAAGPAGAGSGSRHERCGLGGPADELATGDGERPHGGAHRRREPGLAVVLAGDDPLVGAGVKPSAAGGQRPDGEGRQAVVRDPDRIGQWRRLVVAGLVAGGAGALAEVDAPLDERPLPDPLPAVTAIARAPEHAPCSSRPECAAVRGQRQDREIRHPLAGSHPGGAPVAGAEHPAPGGGGDEQRCVGFARQHREPGDGDAGKSVLDTDPGARPDVEEVHATGDRPHLGGYGRGVVAVEAGRGPQRVGGRGLERDGRRRGRRGSDPAGSERAVQAHPDRLAGAGPCRRRHRHDRGALRRSVGHEPRIARARQRRIGGQPQLVGVFVDRRRHRGARCQCVPRRPGVEVVQGLVDLRLLVLPGRALHPDTGGHRHHGGQPGLRGHAERQWRRRGETRAELVADHPRPVRRPNAVRGPCRGTPRRRCDRRRRRSRRARRPRRRAARWRRRRGRRVVSAASGPAPSRARRRVRMAGCRVDQTGSPSVSTPLMVRPARGSAPRRARPAPARTARPGSARGRARPPVADRPAGSARPRRRRHPAPPSPAPRGG